MRFPAVRHLLFSIRRLSLRFIVLWALPFFFIGCATTNTFTNTPRTITEQMLLSQSIQRSFVHASIPLASGSTIDIEIASLSADNAFVEAAILGWLGRQGFDIPKNGKETYLLRVRLDSFGTDMESNFIGMPETQSIVIPVSLPELALYKSTQQTALIQFSVDIFEKASGRYLMSTPIFEGDSYLSDYTFLFFFNGRVTDLIFPPP